MRVNTIKKEQALMSLLLIISSMSIHKPAEAGLFNKVKDRITNTRDRVRDAAIETHPSYLQLVAALKGAKATKVITSRAECNGAVNDASAGIRTVINISPMIHAIGKDAGYRACRQVF